jgi:hypothetical protein
LDSEFFSDFKIPVSIYEASREGEVNLEKKNNFSTLRGMEKLRPEKTTQRLEEPESQN